MVKFNIHWFETCCDFDKFSVEVIDDAERTPGSSRQYTRFNSKVKPEIEKLLNDDKITFKDLEKFLKKHKFKIVDQWNTEEDEVIVNHYIIDNI